MNQIAIDVRRKCFRTGGGDQPRVALQDLRLSGRAGEFVCLFGPSGCGKTTVLNIVAGLDADFDGKVDLPTAEGRTTPVIGYVFQDPRLLPWRTVEENIRLAIDDAAAANGRIGSLLSAMGLDSHRNAFPGQLSLGLARRVALARAFVVEPDLLLMDEPFASLDAPTAERLRRLLIEIWSPGARHRRHPHRPAATPPRRRRSRRHPRATAHRPRPRTDPDPDVVTVRLSRRPRRPCG